MARLESSPGGTIGGRPLLDYLLGIPLEVVSTDVRLSASFILRGTHLTGSGGANQCETVKQYLIENLAPSSGYALTVSLSRP